MLIGHELQAHGFPELIIHSRMLGPQTLAKVERLPYSVQLAIGVELAAEEARTVC